MIFDRTYIVSEGHVAGSRAYLRQVLFYYISSSTIYLRRDPAYSTSSGKTSNCWLGDTLDVVSENLSMTSCTQWQS